MIINYSFIYMYIYYCIIINCSYMFDIDILYDMIEEIGSMLKINKRK